MVVAGEEDGTGQAAETEGDPGAESWRQGDEGRQQQQGVGRPHEHGDGQRGAGAGRPAHMPVGAQRAQDERENPSGGDEIAHGLQGVLKDERGNRREQRQGLRPVGPDPEFARGEIQQQGESQRRGVTCRGTVAWRNK